MVAPRPLSLVVALSLVGCGQRGMVRTSGQVRQHMLAGEYEAALQTLHRHKHESFRKQDRVVYWLNEGFLLHLVGRYQASNRVFELAERRAEELFTQSISKSVKAAFVSPAALDYPGEDYEKVLIHVVRALNYLALEQIEEALVEARKINERLRYYNSKYEHQNRYNQDAFAHWLAGMLFEQEGSLDDARISFEKALEVYQRDFAIKYGLSAPPFVAEDLVRVVHQAGDERLARRYADRYGASGDSVAQLQRKGEVVLVHFNGEGPSKSDLFITCWFRDVTVWRCDGEPGGEFLQRTRIDIPSDGTVVKVAFPQLHLHEPAHASLSLQVGSARARSVPAYPLNAIAAKTMADKMHRVFRDAIIRVITKATSQQVAGAAGRKAGGGFAAWLAKTAASVAMQVSEESDKRAWTTLPARIDIARAMVNPGVHDLQISLPDGQTATMPDITVEAGERVFVSYRSLP